MRKELISANKDGFVLVFFTTYLIRMTESERFRIRNIEYVCVWCSRST